MSGIPTANGEIKIKSPAEDGRNDVISIAQSMSVSGISKFDFHSFRKATD